MTKEIPTFGSRAQVWHGSCKKTRSGLTKKDLMMRKGRVISKKQHAAGKKAIKYLFAAGYKPKKGTFKLFRKGDAKKSEKKSTKKRSTRRRSTRRRGGSTAALGATGAALKETLGL